MSNPVVLPFHQLFSAPPIFGAFQDTMSHADQQQQQQQQPQPQPQQQQQQSQHHSRDNSAYDTRRSSDFPQRWEQAPDDRNSDRPSMTLPPINQQQWDDRASYSEWQQSYASFPRPPYPQPQYPNSQSDTPNSYAYGPPENSYTITNTHDARYHPPPTPFSPTVSQQHSSFPSQHSPTFLSSPSSSSHRPQSPYTSSSSSIVADPNISRQLPPLTSLGVNPRPATPSGSGIPAPTSTSSMDWPSRPPTSRSSNATPTTTRSSGPGLGNTPSARGTPTTAPSAPASLDPDRSSDERSSTSGAPTNASLPSSSVASTYFITSTGSAGGENLLATAGSLGSGSGPGGTRLTPARTVSAATTAAAATSSGAVKPKRRRADANQLRTLNATYDRTAFPSTEERAELARKLGMSPRQVQIWFQNKRQSFRQTRNNSASSQSHVSPGASGVHAGQGLHSASTSPTGPTGITGPGSGPGGTGGGHQPGTFGSIQLSPSSAPPPPATISGSGNGVAYGGGGSGGAGYSRQGLDPHHHPSQQHAQQGYHHAQPIHHLQHPQHSLSTEPNVIRLDTAPGPSPVSSVQPQPQSQQRTLPPLPLTSPTSGGSERGGGGDGDSDDEYSPGTNGRSLKSRRYR